MNLFPIEPMVPDLRLCVKLLEVARLPREPLETVTTFRKMQTPRCHLKTRGILPQTRDGPAVAPERPRQTTPPGRSAASGSLGRGQEEIGRPFLTHFWLWVQVRRFRAQGRTTNATLSIAHPEKWEIIGFPGPHVLIQHAIFSRYMVGLPELQEKMQHWRVSQLQSSCGSVTSLLLDGI